MRDRYTRVIDGEGVEVDPYFLPDDGRRYLVHVSGGRTSGFMLRRILDAHGGSLPEYARAVFANTGKERPETLRFIGAMEAAWGVPITCLEYTYRPFARGGLRDPKNTWREVSPASASLDGRPFEEMIRSRAMLPNVVMRMCTEELKVNTANRWARDALRWGWRVRWSVLGIRHDEPRRWRKALFDECRTVYPLVHGEVSEGDVLGFWGRQSFDLGLRPDQGNCDLCFLKGQAKLRQLISEEPERADWWIRQEARREMEGINGRPATRDPTIQQFLKRRSFTQLRQEALSMPMLPLRAVDDEGEAPAGVSCFCGD